MNFRLSRDRCARRIPHPLAKGDVSPYGGDTDHGWIDPSRAQQPHAVIGARSTGSCRLQRFRATHWIPSTISTGATWDPRRWIRRTRDLVRRERHRDLSGQSPDPWVPHWRARPPARCGWERPLYQPWLRRRIRWPFGRQRRHRYHRRRPLSLRRHLSQRLQCAGCTHGKAGQSPYQHDCFGPGVGAGQWILTKRLKSQAYSLAGGVELVLDIEGHDHYDRANFSQDTRATFLAPG